MILFHTIKAFLIAALTLPLFILSALLFFIAELLAMTYRQEYEFHRLNPFKTYRIVKRNALSGDYDIRTGKLKSNWHLEKRKDGLF